MIKPSPAQLEMARRLLSHEGAAGSAPKSAEAAGRVFDQLHAHVDPLLGADGVQALLLRSAKLTQNEPGILELAIVGGSAKLRVCLAAQDPATSPDSAVALFGTFLTLMTTFIGERLTTQILRRAWPTLDLSDPSEEKQ